MTKRNYGKWTKEKEDVLKELYPQTPNNEICERLGITMRALYSKANLLGLKKKNGKTRDYTDEQYDLVRREYPYMTNKMLVVISGVRLSAIKHWAYDNKWGESKQYWDDKREYYNQKHGENITKYQRYYLKHRERIKAYNRRRYREMKAKSEQVSTVIREDSIERGE